VRIATFNANSIRARLETVRAWLESHRPDVLCVQETKVLDGLFPAEPLRAAGYHAAFRGEKAYNGVAILSRQAPDAVRAGFDDGGPADATRLLEARFGRVTVVDTYVPQGRELDHPMYAYKQEWFRRLRRRFDRDFRPADLVLWAGDLNVAREPIDVYDPASHGDHVCYHAAVRAAFEEALGWGFVDVFRRFHPGEPDQYTFYDYRMPNALRHARGWRLDYLLASPALAAAARACAIDLEPRRAPQASDHTFLYADFDA
jgi:exodeoxyribonuclease-3